MCDNSRLTKNGNEPPDRSCRCEFLCTRRCSTTLLNVRCFVKINLRGFFLPNNVVSKHLLTCRYDVSLMSVYQKKYILYTCTSYYARWSSFYAAIKTIRTMIVWKPKSCYQSYNRSTGPNVSTHLLRRNSISRNCTTTAHTLTYNYHLTFAETIVTIHTWYQAFSILYRYF